MKLQTHVFEPQAVEIPEYTLIKLLIKLIHNF